MLDAYTEEAAARGIDEEREVPERIAIKTEQREVVQAAIDRLPPKQREVITLYYMQSSEIQRDSLKSLTVLSELLPHG